MKGVSSMQAVRDLASNLEEERKIAVAALPQLEKEYNDFVFAEAGEYHLFLCIDNSTYFNCLVHPCKSCICCPNDVGGEWSTG